MNQDLRNFGDPDVQVSVSAARLVWLAMRDAIRNGEPTDFAPEYFCGFSHACKLTFVISESEWHVVRHEMADKRAHEICRQQTAAFLGAPAPQRQDL